MPTKVEQIPNKPVTISITPDIKGGLDNSVDVLSENTKARLLKSGIDLSKGYPERPPTSKIPIFLDDAKKLRDKPIPYTVRGKNADPEKKALFGAAKEVRHLTKYIGTEIVGVQLADLNEQQLDELALLIAERVVVFFKDQDLSIQKQLELGEFWGPVETHAQAQYVPGYPEVRVISSDIAKKEGLKFSYKHSKGTFTSNWHTDLTHEVQTAGITHLHLDQVPDAGGDTSWASGYAAFDKLSPNLQKFLEGKYTVQRSLHKYLDRDDPLSGAKVIEREQPLIRTHPVTGWKSLFVNRGHTLRIVGLEPGESQLILNYLFDVIEKNLDIQVRFNWKPSKPGLGTSAIWDNRISNHYAVNDQQYGDGLGAQRHGTRVSSLGEVAYFDPQSKSQRESLGLKP